MQRRRLRLQFSTCDAFCCFISAFRCLALRYAIQGIDAKYIACTARLLIICHMYVVRMTALVAIIRCVCECVFRFFAASSGRAHKHKHIHLMIVCQEKSLSAEQLNVRIASTRCTFRLLALQTRRGNPPHTLDPTYTRTLCV